MKNNGVFTIRGWSINESTRIVQAKLPVYEFYSFVLQGFHGIISPHYEIEIIIVI
jgi:hypothetical protein